MIRTIFAATTMLLAVPAAAQTANAVALNSDVMVERTSTDAQGRTQTTLETPRVVVPGDNLVFILRYQNNGARPATDFTITNPLPTAVAFTGAQDASAVVSVDGGRNWGQLAQLTVRNQDGSTRPARADEVTHVRWTFAQPIPAGQAGRLMFRGIVR
jgi:uncharacterized repeat protein (TIGR01451 family)